jgi:hypothetical protein
MTGAILALFMAMVCECLVRVHKSHIATSRKLTNLRAASTLMDRMGRELRCCDQVYYPDPNAVLAAYTPVALSATPLVFRYHVASGYTVVGYKLDAAAQKVERMVYAQDYDPAVIASQTVLSSRKFLETAESLNVTQLDVANTNGLFYLHLELKLALEHEALSSEVKARGL